MKKAKPLNNFWKKNRKKIIYELRSFCTTFVAVFGSEILITLDGNFMQSLRDGLMVAVCRSVIKTIIELSQHGAKNSRNSGES